MAKILPKFRIAVTRNVIGGDAVFPCTGAPVDLR